MKNNKSLDLGAMFREQIEQIRKEAFEKGVIEGRRLQREETLANVAAAFAKKTIPRNKPWSIKGGKKGRSTTSQSQGPGRSKSSAPPALDTTT